MDDTNKHNGALFTCFELYISAIFDANISRACDDVYEAYVKIMLLQTLQWRHNGLRSVSNHQPHDCLLNRLSRRRSNKTSNLRVNGICVVNTPGPENSLHKWPVTGKMFPFDDVIMDC